MNVFWALCALGLGPTRAFAARVVPLGLKGNAPKWFIFAPFLILPDTKCVCSHFYLGLQVPVRHGALFDLSSDPVAPPEATPVQIGGDRSPIEEAPPPNPSRRATHGRAAAPDGAMAAQWQLKVAVESLRPQDVIEIGVTPETTWEEAKLAACQVAYAEPVDVATRRLLFRGRERSPTATLGRDGVRPGHKLMLVESDESKRERARAAQEAQMEQIRAERQRHHASSVHRDGVGGTVGDGGAVGDGARLAERCRAEVDTAVRAADALERELGELERATERAVQGGVASAMGAAVPKDVAFLHLGDRLEKALISLDGVDTGGEDDLRALRKGAVRRIQALMERGDAARARAAGAR